MDFVLSDETKDRMGDVIRADGWQIGDFKKNPIALFSHRSDFPIGTWKNLRIEKKQLLGTLELAPEGTSSRIDEVIKLVKAGILRAVSVGFRSIESRPFGTDWRDGMEFLKQELVETSVVGIPANPNALAVAKSIGISDETREMVFKRQRRVPVLTVPDFDLILESLQFTRCGRSTDMRLGYRAQDWASLDCYTALADKIRILRDLP